MKNDVKQCLEEILEERQRVWLTEPEEIRKARKLKGTYGNRYAHFEYARGDLHGCADALSYFLESLKNEAVELASLKFITDRCLEFYLRRMSEWYKQHTIEGLLRNVQAVLDNVESKEEYKQVIEELLRYVGKLSWWFDLETPWLQLSQLYELIVPE
jgi:predicted TIM-barrel fold metal-dependent hydrolase